MSRFNKITFRLLAGFLLLSPLPLAGLAWFYMQAFEQAMRQSELAKLSSIADKKADQINTYIGERLSDSRLLAASPNVTDTLLALSTAAVDTPRYHARALPYVNDLHALRLEESGYYDLLLTDASGHVVFSVRHEPDFGSNLNTDPERDGPLAKAHRDAMRLRNTQITAVYLDAPSGNKPAIFIVSPVLRNGKVFGTLAAQLDMNKLTSVTSDSTGLGETGETVLAQRENDEGLYVSPLKHIPDAAFRYRATLESMSPPMKAALLGEHGVGISFDYAGVGVISAWRYLPSLHWGMVVKIDEAEALAPLYRLQKSIFVSLAILILLASLIAFLLGRALLAPIRKLINATGMIAEGDLSQRAPVQGWAELQQLAVSFNRMAEHVQSTHTQLESLVEQRTAELSKALAQGQEAQRLAQLGNWELDLVTGKLYWSDEIFHLFEIDKARFDATYEAFLNAIHPDDRLEVNRAYTRSLETKSTYEITHRLLMNDGRIKWVRERCESDFDADGKPLRSVGTVQDISEQKRIELALEQNESLFRTLAQVAPVGIFRTDPAGNCTYVNEHYCEIAGLKRDAALGNGWATAIHPDDRENVFKRWTEAVNNSMLFFLEYRFVHPSGFITWVVGQARAEIDSHGKVRGYVGTITDINQLKYAEAALQRLNDLLEQRVEQRTAQLLSAKEEAEQASRTKSLFLASMSHELRTPLNAILGYAQLMQIDPKLPVHIVENAHEIKRAGDYLLSLMNDILDLARIESGRLEIQITAFALSEIVNECCVQNSQLAANHSITLVHHDSCNLYEVKADSRRLLQVLNNLISNAIKYNRNGGKVSVSCSIVAPGRIRVAVADTGLGIAPEQQAHLFEPFNRLGAEMGKIEGTGIGLVIARKLIESMQGSIGVESTPGIGSTFWVEVPAAEKSAVEAVTTKMQNQTNSIKKVRVLVAEDYVANQMVLRLQLQALGCEVDIAADGTAALAIWRTTRHDLILTDLNMPVMNGLALAQAVRAEERSSGGHVPIIAITAAEACAEREHCRAAGMDDVLTKPIALEGLRAVLSRHLGNISTAQPAGKPVIAGNAILDAEQLYRILGRVDSGQARELVTTFLRSAREGLIRLAVNSSDREEVAREMHKLKSSARTIGAMHFAQLAETLELRSKEGVSDSSAARAELLRALHEVEAAKPNLLLDAENPAAQTHGVIPSVRCRSVLVIDDDQVVLQQMEDMLTTLGVTEVLTTNNGFEAIELVESRSSELEALICDLNMPAMDGVELIRQFGQTGFNGGLILMSGTDEKVLSTVSRLAGLQGLRVLGQVQKPVLPHQIANLLAHIIDVPVGKRQAAAEPAVTKAGILAGMTGDQFSVWFQPKVDASSLQPAGLEALARWQLPNGNFIPPDLFITVAEQEGLIGELSKVLVASALKEGAKLFAAGFPLKIAINLSGRWLDDLNLPEFILGNTLFFGLHAEDIILEVTETGVMEDLTTALDVLTRLRLKGFGLSIDDFGIGYSSFEQLGRIPFTELKLDRSFVSKGLQDASAAAILESSMSMARKLGLSTVAEGVETEAELELVRSLGCDRVQGYLIAKPMPLDDLLAWLRSRQPSN